MKISKKNQKIMIEAACVLWSCGYEEQSIHVNFECEEFLVTRIVTDGVVSYEVTYVD